MRRPSSLDFVVGNRPVRLGLFCASAAALYRFALGHDDVMGGLSLAGVVLYRYAARARERVGTYRGWKQTWDRMTDAGGEGKSAPKPPRRLATRGRVLFAIWVVLALWLNANPGSPEHGDVAIGFAVLSLWGAGKILLRFFRRKPSAKARKAESCEFVVRVVPGVAKASPSIARITASLPAYAKRLMAASR